MNQNLASLRTSRSFCYLSWGDFVSAFGSDASVLIIKDHRQIRFNFESDTQETNSNSLLLSSHKQVELRDVHIIGDVLRPTQVQLVNSEAKLNSDSSLLFCFDKIPDDDDADNAKRALGVQRTIGKKKNKTPQRSMKLNLFRRRLKPKKFLELEEEEREQLASQVLNRDKFKDKSMFYYIKDQQLVAPSDYIDPDFIDINQPPDTEYESNYSTIAPSIHDLFDIDVEPLVRILKNESEDDLPDIDEDYEMIEYLEEDQEDDT